MKIIEFHGTKIHGYLNFSVPFNDDLTFLTGINGSGKTSVIQSVIALLQPSFFVLANLEYETIHLKIQHENQELIISASRDANKFSLSTSQTTQILTISIFDPDPEELAYKATEKENDYYQQVYATLGDHEVVDLISKLPTPMFLDLDRRAQAIQDRRVMRPPIGANPKRGRNIFAFFLSQSLRNATSMAEGSYRISTRKILELGEQLRKRMILDLLELEHSPYGIGPWELPSHSELLALAEMRKSVESLPQIFQLDKQDVEIRLVPTLERMETYAKSIPKNKSTDEILQGNPKDPAFQALLGGLLTRGN